MPVSHFIAKYNCVNSGATSEPTVPLLMTTVNPQGFASECRQLEQHLFDIITILEQ